MLAKQVGDVCAFRVDPLFTVFHKDKVVLWPDPSFLLKVVLSFYLSQSKILPGFFLDPLDDLQIKLHNLDVTHVCGMHRNLDKDKQVAYL